MGISRMMSQQVQQSEETVQTLGTAGIWAWLGRREHLWAALSAVMVSRTPLTAGHKQEISVCFVWGCACWSFCAVTMRRNRGQDEVESLVKAVWAPSAQSVWFYSVPLSWHGLGDGRGDTSMDPSPCTEEGVSAELLPARLQLGWLRHWDQVPWTRGHLLCQQCIRDCETKISPSSLPLTPKTINQVTCQNWWFMEHLQVAAWASSLLCFWAGGNFKDEDK